jgi:putative copper export protein
VIVEYLQPNPSLLDGATVLLRAALYATTLGAAGLGLFLAGFAHRLDEGGLAHLRAWLRGAALAALAVSVASLLLRALVLSGGESALDPAVWQAMLASRIGDAALIRGAGLVLLLLAALRVPAAAALAGMGALMVCASYAAMGHSTLYRPRQELAALVTLHLLAVAFWIGALPPLARAAERGETALIHAWSRAAVAAVAVLAAVGAVAAVLLLRSPASVAGSWYGWGFVAKMGVFAALLAMAIWHRRRLTPALDRHENGAGDRLARSIRREMAVALLVMWAAAEMVSVHPPDLGHRVTAAG